MYTQLISGYTTAFKHAPWRFNDSEHYRFHYIEGSVAEREIEYIVEIQETAFKQVLDFLEVSQPEKKIFYYLYPDSATKERLMGSSWFAQAVYEDYAIHALYTEVDRVIGPHEITHLLSLPFGLAIGFMQEGLADRMVGKDWYGNLFLDTMREALKDEHFLISPDLLIAHQAWHDIPDGYTRQYYALAALFTDYLIDGYGKQKYLQLYAALSRDASMEENGAQYMKVLGAPIEEVFASWKEHIQAWVSRV